MFVENEDVTVKILEIIKDMKQRQEAAETRQRELSGMVSSLEAKIGEAAAGNSGNGNAGALEEIKRKYDRRIQQLDENFRSILGEFEKIKSVNNKIRLMELSMMDGSENAKKEKEDMSELMENMKNFEEKNREAARHVERHLDDISKEHRKELEDMEIKIGKRIAGLDGNVSEISRRMQSLHADENELKKISELIEFIERKIDSEKRNAELRMKTLIERDEARIGVLEEEFEGIGKMVHAESEKSAGQQVKAKFDAYGKGVEERIRGMEDQLTRLDDMEKSIQSAENRAIRLSEEIRSQQERFLKDILKGLNK